MAVRALVASFVLLTLIPPAVAQTPPPSPGGVLNNPEAPRPPPPANPSGVPPLILPFTILTPGSGH